MAIRNAIGSESLAILQHGSIICVVSGMDGTMLAQNAK